MYSETVMYEREESQCHTRQYPVLPCPGLDAPSDVIQVVEFTVCSDHHYLHGEHGHCSDQHGANSRHNHIPSQHPLRSELSNIP